MPRSQTSRKTRIGAENPNLFGHQLKII
jgi:hypothetical protein